MLRSIAAARERRYFHSPSAPRCVSKHEDEQRASHSSPCQTAHLVPAAHFCARGLQLRFTHPESRVGGAARVVRVLGGTPVRRAHNAARQALARRLASHNAGRSPLGAPPWRFFTRGRASLTGICAGSVTASSSQPGRSAWRAASRASRGQRLQAAAAGRHASLRIQDRL